jgi:hypothetical protein
LYVLPQFFLLMILFSCGPSMHNSNLYLVAKITQLCTNYQVCDSWYELDLEDPIYRRMEDCKGSGFDQFSNA